MMSSPNWLSRYRDGQRDQVWQEMRQLGRTIRGSDLVEEAQLVCDEMAHRARHNVEVIVERLTDDGYRFHSNDDEQTPETPLRPSDRNSNAAGGLAARTLRGRTDDSAVLGAVGRGRLAGRNAPAVAHIGLG